MKEDACMKFYVETKSLYIETNAHGFRLGATLLQPKSNTSCHKDKAQDNRVLRSIVSASKGMTGPEKIQQHRKKKT